MIIHEKLTAIATDITGDLFQLIGTKFFLNEARQNCDLPYVVFRMQKMPLISQNGPLCRMRPWMLYLYPHGAKPLSPQIVGAQLEETFCDYKKTTAGAADTDIQAITVDTGIADLEPFNRAPTSKIYVASLVLKVYEQIGA